jgi:Holliday junction resolvasome RuvABC endonuclease subunit
VIALGIDPGFAFLGIGVLDMSNSAARVLHHETFKTTTKDTDSDRLDALCERIICMIDEYQPALVGYENQAMAEVGAQMRREKQAEEGVAAGGTSYSSRRVHEISGAIRCAARLFELPCYCLAPATIKVAVLGKGGGHAKKDRVKLAVRTIFHVKGCSEHAADAIAIGLAAVGAHRKQLVLMRALKGLIH